MIPIRDRLAVRTTPYVTYALIATNALAFLWESFATKAYYPGLVVDWGFVPARFLSAPNVDLLTLFSSMFLHGGLLHLIGNMLFLKVFGDNVEDAVGHLRFSAFYLIGGIVAALVQLMIDPSSIVPMIGASGAISAVLAAYLTIYPRARVTVLVPIFVIASVFEFPAWLVILEWFAIQVLQGFISLAGAPRAGGVAWFAHIGGFVAGLVLIRGFMIGRTRQSYEPWRRWRDVPSTPWSA